MAPKVPKKTVGRLSLYRRLLVQMQSSGVKNAYSHELARISACTPAQVRRDLMSVGYSGSPTKGYDVASLIHSIGQFLDAPEPEGVALVGVGNLGRAILSYFAGRRPKLTIVAAFDSDSAKVNRVIHGCWCDRVDALPRVIAEKGIRIGIITVPGSEAQAVADMMVRAGLKGILNFAPVPLRIPPDVYVEDVDMTMSLEKVAFFARRNSGPKE